MSSPENVDSAVARMKAWAAANPGADTQGLMDDEWEGLARAALDVQEPCPFTAEEIEVLRYATRCIAENGVGKAHGFAVNLASTRSKLEAMRDGTL